MKQLLLALYLLVGCFSSFAAPVAMWMPPTNAAPYAPKGYYSYEVGYGTASQSYSNIIDAQTNTSIVLSNLTPNAVYYIAVRTYMNFTWATNRMTNTVTFSVYTPEVVFTNAGPEATNIIFLGVKLEYGSGLSSLETKRIGIKAFTNPPAQQFYRMALLLTNKPFEGVKSSDDTNSYRFLGVRLQYGVSLAQLSTEIKALLTRTNAPANEFYRGSLIITNKPLE
jgi:hypothetical protein